MKFDQLPHLFLCVFVTTWASGVSCQPGHDTSADLLTIDNGTVKIGIDRNKGASITWLSWADHPKNIINIHDPGRLLQQSYYAGIARDRTAEGQSTHWSPWRWNPIQGGGIDSWAQVTRFEKPDDHTLYGETIPNLWDMPDEAADATMHQWTAFEPGMPNVIVVRNKITCDRELDDPWGPAIRSPQEVPACYFTRNFDRFESYLGEGAWRRETQPAGPPWGRTQPPQKAMACFNADGHGVAIYSPTAGDTWNFGPHREEQTDDPEAGPCVHVAPVTHIPLGPQSTYTYRYWLILGDQQTIATTLDTLIANYAQETGTLTNPDNN